MSFASHCLTHHHKFLILIGLNEWECHKVAYGKLPEDVQAFTYKRKPTTITDLLMAQTARGDDALNQHSENQDN